MIGAGAGVLSRSILSVLSPRSLLYTVSQSASVSEAVERMATKGVGSLVVTEKKSAGVVGIFTERDFLLKMRGRCSDETAVRDVMTSSVRSVPTGTSVAACLEIMIENDFRHLPVVQPTAATGAESATVVSGEFIGVVSMRDVVRALVQQKAAESEYLQEQIDKLANAVGSGGGASTP